MFLLAVLASQRRTVAVAALALIALSAGALTTFGPDVLPHHVYTEVGLSLFVGGAIALLLALTHLLVAAVRLGRQRNARRVVLLPSPHHSESDEESELLRMSEQETLKLAISQSSRWTRGPTTVVDMTPNPAKRTESVAESTATTFYPYQHRGYTATATSSATPLVALSVHRPAPGVVNAVPVVGAAAVQQGLLVQRAKQELMDLL